MKTWVVIMGLLMMFIGGGLYLAGVAGAQSYEGQWATSENLENLSMYSAMAMFGLAIGIGGFITLIVGLILGEKQQYQRPVQYPQQYPPRAQQYPQTFQQRPQYQQQPIPQPTQQGEMKLCENCYAKLDFNWVLCPHCGHKVRDSQPQPQIRYCNYCKKQIPIDSIACPYCGRRNP